MMASPDWNKEFEIMCDASDYAMGAVLGQRTEKILKAIIYSKNIQVSFLQFPKDLGSGRAASS